MMLDLLDILANDQRGFYMTPDESHEPYYEARPTMSTNKAKVMDLCHGQKTFYISVFLKEKRKKRVL
jgi:hypothetical protein